MDKDNRFFGIARVENNEIKHAMVKPISYLEEAKELAEKSGKEWIFLFNENEIKLCQYVVKIQENVTLKDILESLSDGHSLIDNAVHELREYMTNKQV